MEESHELGFDLKEALFSSNITMKDVDKLRQQIPKIAPNNLTTKQAAERFSEWVNKLSDNEQTNISKELIKEYFSVDLQIEPLAAIKINPTELRTIPHSISTKWNLPKLVVFLNAANNKVDDAQALIEIYYEARRSNSVHFHNRDPCSSAIQQCLNNQAYFVLPPTPRERCPIVYHKVTSPRAADYFFDNAVKVYCMSMDVALHKYGSVPGIIFLHDMQNVGLGHLFRANLASIKNFLHYLQNGLPASVCRIHILNVIPLFHKILTIVKPFLKKGLLDVIHVHQSNMDYEEFYKTSIPKSHLPSDYGGELSSIEDLHSNFCDEFIKMRKYFIAEELQRLPESTNSSS